MMRRFAYGKLFIISILIDVTKMLRDLQGKSVANKMYGPHKDAVLDFAWNNSLVVSGDKGGTIAFWVTVFNILLEH